MTPYETAFWDAVFAGLGAALVAKGGLRPWHVFFIVLTGCMIGAVVLGVCE